LFLEREHDFENVSDRSTSLTFIVPVRPTFLAVSERFNTLSRLFSSLKKVTNAPETLVERSCKRSGTVNGYNAERLGTNSGKRSRSRFKNERIAVNKIKD
jgi:hypothetical protein